MFSYFQLQFSLSKFYFVRGKPIKDPEVCSATVNFQISFYWILFTVISVFTFKCHCCPHIETSQLICIANQLTDFCMRATLALSGLNRKKNCYFLSYWQGNMNRYCSILLLSPDKPNYHWTFWKQKIVFKFWLTSCYSSFAVLIPGWTS